MRTILNRVTENRSMTVWVHLHESEPRDLPTHRRDAEQYVPDEVCLRYERHLGSSSVKATINGRVINRKSGQPGGKLYDEQFYYYHDKPEWLVDLIEQHRPEWATS